MNKFTKTIPINGIGVHVDLTAYKPIVEHPKFVRLGRIQQIPFGQTLYEGCVHTRREHSIGCFYLTERICKHIQKEYGTLTDEDINDLKISALLHDLGHAPFSHVVENAFSGFSHDKKILRLIEEIGEEIEKCHGRAEIVQSILSRQSALHYIISSILGADKLDYVQRDLYHCGLGQVPQFEKLLDSLVFKNDKYGVLPTQDAGNALVSFLKAWWDAHRQIYLHKEVEKPRAMFQKALLYEFDPEDIEEISEWDDFELIARLRSSEDKRVKKLMNYLENNKYYKEIAVLKLDEYEQYEDSDVPVFTLTTSEMKKMKSAEYTRSKEKELARELNIPEESIIITNSQDIERLNPEKKAVNFINHEPEEASKIYPDFFSYLKEEMNRHFAVRLLVEPERADELKSKLEGENIKKLLI